MRLPPYWIANDAIMTIELTDRQLALLSDALAVATGCVETREERLELIYLANFIHKNNPEWEPISEDLADALAAIMEL